MSTAVEPLALGKPMGQQCAPADRTIAAEDPEWEGEPEPGIHHQSQSLGVDPAVKWDDYQLPDAVDSIGHTEVIQ